MTTERPLCLPEIDAGIVAARWKWLHATWADDTTAVAAFRAEIDGLLEQRHAITTAGTMIGRN